MARPNAAGDLRSATQRRAEILRVLRAAGEVRSVDLASDLGVTHETVRKDLLHLESRSLLRRVHGGALPVESLSYEPEVSARTTQTAEKRRIAEAAAAYVPEQGAVLLDAGSTTAALAEVFPPSARVTVVTNTLPIALSMLAHPNVTVHTLGGRVRATTMAEVDRWALRALDETRGDVAFLGSNACSVEDGLSTPDDAEAAVKSAMVRAARRRILLVDHTKFERSSVFRYADMSDVDVVVTDRGLAAQRVRALESIGVEVVLA